MSNVNYQTILFFALICIIVIGIVGIPMGDPKFLIQAITLESVFVLLAILSIKKFNLVLIPCIILGSIVIAGNTISPRHIEIMSSFSPPENALVLLIGGYVLQVIIITVSLMQLKKQKQIELDNDSLN